MKTEQQSANKLAGFSKFSPESLNVIVCAQNRAIDDGAAALEKPYLLWALMQQESIKSLLWQLGVPAYVALSKVEAQFVATTNRRKIVLDDFKLSAESKKILFYVVDEYVPIRKLTPQFEPEHLFLAWLHFEAEQPNDGNFFKEYGLTLKQARAAVKARLKSGKSSR